MSDTTQAPTTPAAPAAEPAKPPIKAPKAAEAKPPPEPAKPAGGAKPAEAPPPKADEWAKIAAQEKRAAAERKKLEEARKALDEERKAHADRLSLIDQAKAGSWEAREKLLAETGLSYDEWTKRQLASRKPPDPAEVAKRTAAEEFARLEKARAEETAKAAEAAEAERWKGVIGAFTEHVKTAKPPESAGLESFVLLGDAVEHNGNEVDAWLRHMASTHPTLTIPEACVSLEKALRADHDRRAARLRPPAPTPAEAPKTSEQQRPRDQGGRFERSGDGPRTLTNGLSAERSAPAARDSGRPKTRFERDQEDRERLRRAAAALPRR